MYIATGKMVRHSIKAENYCQFESAEKTTYSLIFFLQGTSFDSNQYMQRKSIHMIVNLSIIKFVMKIQCNLKIKSLCLIISKLYMTLNYSLVGYD